MSRPIDPTGAQPVAITFHVTQEVAEDIESIRKRDGGARSELLRRWVERGIREHKRSR